MAHRDERWRGEMRRSSAELGLPDPVLLLITLPCFALGVLVGVLVQLVVTLGLVALLMGVSLWAGAQQGMQWVRDKV